MEPGPKARLPDLRVSALNPAMLLLIFVILNELGQLMHYTYMKPKLSSEFQDLSLKITFFLSFSFNITLMTQMS